MRFEAFVGPSYVSRSVVADNQRVVNLYPEIIESGSGKSRVVYYRTPGLAVFCTLTDTRIRVIHENPATGRVFAIAGGTLFELFSDGTFTSRGSVSSSGNASMASSTTQLIIASGNILYCYTMATDTLTPIASPEAAWVTFSDQYFIACEPGTQKIYISGILDGLTWDPLDFDSAEAVPDNLVQVLADHRELWLFGTHSIQPYFNSGAADFPFEPIPGALFEMGAIAGTPQKLDNSLMWVHTDQRGAGQVWRAEGYRPVRVSTHAVEHYLQGLGTLANSFSWVYHDRGHAFYCLTTPTATSTWVYDSATGLWHERAYWNIPFGAFERQRQVCHAYVWSKHLVGDRVNGKVYEQSIDYLDDDGNPIRWLRRSPHVATENKRIFYHSFELDMETGGGEEGDVMMRYSDDGGRNWASEAMATSSGAIGETTRRVNWNRLGSSYDRVFEVYGTDPVEIAIVDAHLELTVGRA